MNTICYRILDNGGETQDRYTLCFETHNPDAKKWDFYCYGASENPAHPQGLSRYISDHIFPLNSGFPKIGRDIEFKECPPGVQHLIKQLETHEG